MSIIVGAKYWNAKAEDPDNDYYSIQSNNAGHQIINKVMNGPVKRWEWCGPESLGNIGGVLRGWKWMVNHCKVGDADIQFGDHAMNYFHDPKRYPAFTEVVPGPDWESDWPNRYIELYSMAGWDLLHLYSEVEYSPQVFHIKTHLQKGGAVLICLLRPGHYRTVKAYDCKNDMFICDDPWPEGFGGNGYSIKMSHTEMVENTHGPKVFFNPPEDN